MPKAETEPCNPISPVSAKLENVERKGRLAAPDQGAPLIEFLESLEMEGLDLTRDPDNGR